MFDWIRDRIRTRYGADERHSTPPPAAHRARLVAGEYQLLYEYLRDRYANRLILTFGEIEDLIGSSLPDSARLHDTWWSGPVGPRSAQSNAWTLAGRTATVNMLAQNVVFERGEAA